jgi:CheY-like chemotaxis protein
MSLPVCLIVDSDARSAEILGGIMRSHGFETRHVAEPFNALRDLRTHPYDLVLFDLSAERTDAAFVLDVVQRELPHVVSKLVVVTTNPLVASDIAVGVPVVGKSDLRPLMDYLNRGTAS